jgi:hypothetical protein
LSSIVTTKGIQDLTNDLMANFDKISDSYVHLSEALDRHPLPRDTWSKSCGEDNFMCGFWKMLHTASIGIAAQRGGIDIRSGLLKRHVELISPLQAADAFVGSWAASFRARDVRNTLWTGTTTARTSGVAIA